MPAGRPTRYRKSYAKKAYDFCLRHGFTDTELAEMFDVSESTINNWKAKHPEFLASIKKGKREYCLGKIIPGMVRSATGHHEYEETEEISPKANPETGEAELRVVRRVKKYIPPNPLAGKFLATNWAPDEFRERHLHELTGADGGPIVYQPIDRFIVPEEGEDPAEKSAKDPSP